MYSGNTENENKLILVKFLLWVEFEKKNVVAFYVLT